MKAIIEVDISDYQIGQEVSIYFKDTMMIKGIVQEPKTGHWIGIDEEPHEDYECDRCGYVCSTFTVNIKPHEEYKFCPNCGARMESEDKE